VPVEAAETDPENPEAQEKTAAEEDWPAETRRTSRTPAPAAPKHPATAAEREGMEVPAEAGPAENQA